MIWESFNLTKKVALVAGGRGVLGQRFCTTLAEAGATVYAADLPAEPAHVPVDNPTTADNDHATTTSNRNEILQRDVNVTDPHSVRILVEEITAKSGTIDILVYSITAKPHDFYKPFTECSLAGWQTIMQAELDGLFLMTQQVGRVMEHARQGSIILLSSIYGMVGNDQRIYEGANLAQVYTDGAGLDEQPAQSYSHAGYAAAKGAVIAMTRFLAAYWGASGIRVNCISPGGIAHPGENETFVKNYAHRVPLGRKAGRDEVNGALLYLASAASSYVTGHNLVVDGGWSIW